MPDVRAWFCPWFTCTSFSAQLVLSFSQVQAGGLIGLGYFRFPVNSARPRSRPWLVRASVRETFLKAEISSSILHTHDLHESWDAGSHFGNRWKTDPLARTTEKTSFWRQYCTFPKKVVNLSLAFFSKSWQKNPPASKQSLRKTSLQNVTLLHQKSLTFV